MSMTASGKAPVRGSADEGDLGVIERAEHRIERPRRLTPVERREWRGEGVVGDNHTD